MTRTASAIAIPFLLAALLAAVEAAGQQPAPPDSPPDAAACVGGGAIVGGERQPPTPAEVRARQTSPDCRSEASGAPTVDLSPKAGSELDQIYGRLLTIDRDQNPRPGAPNAGGQ
jgi:hypothetical protein